MEAAFVSRHFFAISEYPIGAMAHSSLRFLFGAFCKGLKITLLVQLPVVGISFVCARAAFAPLEESKVVSSHLLMLNPRPVLRAFVFTLLISLFAAAHVSFAYGQATFTITPSPLQPAAVDPGETATSVLNLQSAGGFDSPVSLSCVVTSTQFTTNLPECTISPSSQTPPATPSLTVTTVGSTAASEYTITITGTSGSETETATLILQVVDVQEDYTLTVSKAISPGTVSAGSGAQATVTVTPIGSYTGTVTLSCFSVTPTVVAAPFCSFNPSSVSVTNGAGPTSVLTVNTYGTTQNTAKLWSPRIFYAFWLAVPGLALIGVSAVGTRRRRLLGFFFLLAISSNLLMLPSCNATTTTANNNIGLITPKNTYVFTLTGVDANGVAPSNSTSTTEQATVSLTVN